LLLLLLSKRYIVKKRLAGRRLAAPANCRGARRGERLFMDSVVDTTTATTAAGMINARVLVITGAGVSAESGIPTFRGRDGYWRNLDPAKLATTEAFANDPKLVWEWYRERRERIRTAQPNPAHEAIATLAAEAREFLLVTQNVDDLHARAKCERNTAFAGKDGADSRRHFCHALCAVRFWSTGPSRR
jgi:hypothetical protein